jgi:hypothetical protein
MSATPLSAAQGIVPQSNRPAKGLTDVPNEILLEIIENFQVDIEEPPTFTMSHENKEREETLRSLCLTCKRLSAVSTLVLYSSIILDGPCEGTFIRLSLLLRTILCQPHLAQQIKYVQLPDYTTRFGDGDVDAYMSNNPDSADWEGLFLSMTQAAAIYWGPPRSQLLTTWLSQLQILPELAESALLVALAPNISYLKLGPLCETQPALLKFLGLDMTLSGLDRPTCRFHKLRKLKRFTLMIRSENLYKWTNGDDYDTDPRDLEVMRKLPAPLDLCIIGGGLYDYSIIGFRPSESFPNLSSISFKDTDMTAAEVVHAVRGCNSLTRFEIVWDFSNGPYSLNMSEIASELQTMKETLQYLNLTVNLRAGTPRPQFDFSAFHRLRTLIVPQMMLFGSDDCARDVIEFWTDDRPEVPIGQCLPASLTTLHVVDAHAMCMSDDSVVWWDFARDLHKLPSWKFVTVDLRKLASLESVFVDLDDDRECEHDWTKLIEQFAENGVSLKVRKG